MAQSEEELADGKSATVAGMKELPVVFQPHEVRTCRLCGEKSNSLSPLAGATEFDGFSGLRPWLVYKRRGESKHPFGRTCNICFQVFKQGGSQCLHKPSDHVAHT